MLILKTIATGSKGNCHALMDGDDILLLDLGVNAREIKKGIDFRVSDIVACLVTHKHLDHSRAVPDFRKMGIEVFAPYEQELKKPQTKHFGSFKITALPMLDKQMEVWQHTNTDLSECPIYGFLIETDGQKILYVTDTKHCVWNFKNQCINHMLLGIDFQSEMLAADDAKKAHVITGHMSLSTGVEMVKANATDGLRSVILCHVSDASGDGDKMVAEVEKDAINADVGVAEAGKSFEFIHALGW